MTQLLAATIAFICAWSQPNCVTATQLNNQQRIALSDAGPPSKPFTLIIGRTYWKNGTPNLVVISDALDDVPYTGVVLAHELAEIQRGYPSKGRDCGDYEGYDGAESFAIWFTHTFGPPHPQTYLDSITWFQAQPGHHTPNPC